MKILLLGKRGQVGWELQRSLGPLGEVVALCTKSQNLCGDLADLEGLAKTVREVKPDIIVNAAAYTAVDKAESERELAFVVNAEAPAVLAREAKLQGALLIHYSTDYVFDGSGKQSWHETDETNPLNIYGETKLAGEQAIQQSGCTYLIFRTSWVYGARGNNFAKTMIKLASERESLSVINDQTGSPTGADLLADVTSHAAKMVHANPKLSGLYHLAAAGETTWYDYARFVLGFASNKGYSLKVMADAVEPVSTTAYPTPAQRPLNSRLNTSKLETTFDLKLPNWQFGVERMLREILERQDSFNN